MAFLQQLYQLPYIQIWFPGLIFLMVAGVAYWCLHKHPRLASSPQADTSNLIDLDQAPAPKKAEHRQAKRRQGNPIEIYLAHPEHKNEPERGCVLDRSVGGMRLVSHHDIAVGSILSIRPIHAEAMVPWFDLEVRSCRLSSEIPGEYELGCQFVKTPPYSILLLFG